MAIVNQREVGEDTESVESGLAHALRQDPDVIVAGELSDVASLRIALTAAETGYLVIGSLRHTGAIQTIERVVDECPVDQQRQFRVQPATPPLARPVHQLAPAVDAMLPLAAGA